MKRCKNCGKDISQKHPNAVFCRNKGRGNCKDSYHNKITSPRRNYQAHDDDDNDDYIDEYDGSWDAHNF